ncbi:MAG: two-component sensor histidine kinase, partial [Chloroflexi bacterium]|nr:two-component sensor histidine kinase [Chloroflexota bacterium]
TGTGISPDDLPHVFDRFYRVDPSRNRVTGGAGLGLTIVKRLVEVHGGRIEVDSELGSGTTFTVEIPFSGPASDA